MTLAEERELEIIKDGLIYIREEEKKPFSPTTKVQWRPHSLGRKGN